MNEINDALKKLAANFIGLVADIPGMLRSTRTWMFIVTMAAAYLTMTKSGLTGMEAILAAFVEVILGGAGMAVKTIRSGAPAAANSTKLTFKKELPPAKEKFDIGVSTPTDFPAGVKPPTQELDWEVFWFKVNKEKERLMAEPVDKLEQFALFEAIRNVGRNTLFSDGYDLKEYAQTLLNAAGMWFKEVVGFNYWDAQTPDPKTGKTPLESKGKCPYTSLSQMAYEEGFILPFREVEKASKHVGYCNMLPDDWQRSFPENLRTLNYVYGNIVEVLSTRGLLPHLTVVRY